MANDIILEISIGPEYVVAILNSNFMTEYLLDVCLQKEPPPPQKKLRSENVTHFVMYLSLISKKIEHYKCKRKRNRSF